MDEQTYHNLVMECARDLLAGWSLDEIITNPLGPAAGHIGECDLDRLADCVVLAARAQRITQFPIDVLRSTLQTS